MTPSPDPVHHSTWVRADPETVYDALATGDGLDAWFTAGAEVEPRSGGRIVFRRRNWRAEGVPTEDEGLVIAAERPSRLAFQWHPDTEGPPTTVSITLGRRGGGTVVLVTEIGFRETPSGHAAMLSCASGWGEALTALKMYVEHGIRVFDRDG